VAHAPDINAGALLQATSAGSAQETRSDHGPPIPLPQSPCAPVAPVHEASSGRAVGALTMRGPSSWRKRLLVRSRASSWMSMASTRPPRPPSTGAPAGPAPVCPARPRRWRRSRCPRGPPRASRTCHNQPGDPQPQTLNHEPKKVGVDARRACNLGRAVHRGWHCGIFPAASVTTGCCCRRQEKEVAVSLAVWCVWWHGGNEGRGYGRR